MARRLPKDIIPAIILPIALVLAPNISSGVEKPDATEPVLAGRAPFSADHRQYLLRKMNPEVAPLISGVRSTLGLPGKISPADYEYYMRAETNPIMLYEYIAELGISQEENERLKDAGADLRQSKLIDIGAYHWTAMADVVVRGTVKQVWGNPDGPYHTKIVLGDLARIKTCHARDDSSELMEFWLVESGPHRKDGKVETFTSGAEPQFRPGEEVVVIGGRNPINFRAMLANAILANNAVEELLESYGSTDSILSRASTGDIETLEVYRAYKVVGSNMVIKLQAYRAPQDTDVLGIAEFSAKAAHIAGQQKNYCKSRVGKMEARS